MDARRTEVRPFTPAQIKLLETFADQAVIAIENVRLFKELQERNRDLTEALEQQTATGEMLRVIASSPTDLQPVLDTLLANAVKLSGATKGHVRQLDGEFLRVVAHYGETAEEVALLQSRPGRIGVQTSTNRAFSERKAIQIADAAAERGPSSIAAQHGARTLLAIPLLREGTAIGVITIWRDVVEPFTERQVAVARNFRRSSCDRHRERAIVQGTPGTQRRVARGARASNGDGRGARHHQPLADGRTAGPRRHRRERSPGLWD